MYLLTKYRKVSVLIILLIIVLGGNMTFGQNVSFQEFSIQTQNTIDYKFETPKYNETSYTLEVHPDIIDKTRDKLLIIKNTENKQIRLGSFGYVSPSFMPPSKELEKVKGVHTEVQSDGVVWVLVNRTSENINGIDIFKLSGDNIEKVQVYLDISTNQIYGNEDYINYLSAIEDYQHKNSIDLNSTGITEIFPSKDIDEKIKGYTSKLEKENRTIYFQSYLDKTHYFYILSSQMDTQHDYIQIINVEESGIMRLYEGTYKETPSAPQILKVAINPIHTISTPQVCIFRETTNTIIGELYVLTESMQIQQLALLKLDKDTQTLIDATLNQNAYKFIFDYMNQSSIIHSSHRETTPNT